MFERFTEKSRNVVTGAQDEARLLKHSYIGSEHLLLGLLYEREGLAARILGDLGLMEEEVRGDINRIVGRGEEAVEGQIPFTPRAKKILELALREALSLGHNYIGTEHILLGFVRETDGLGYRILLDHDIDSERVRDAVIRALRGPRPSAISEAPPRTLWICLNCGAADGRVCAKCGGVVKRWVEDR